MDNSIYLRREYKFRAWNRDAKSMGKVNIIHFTEDEPTDVQVESKWLDRTRIMLMQSTSVEDVERNEIFEHDIVEVCFNAQKKFGSMVPSKEDYTGLVVYEQGGFQVVTNFGETGKGWGLNALANMHCTLLIKGNVWQSPEQLPDQSYINWDKEETVCNKCGESVIGEENSLCGKCS